jgi:PadR family transcriptional regulator, regulatory protein AphA
MPRDDSPSPEPLILGFLMFGPAHPYELYREFDRELGRVWRVGQASLYAHLKKAEEAALAKVELTESVGAPDRRVHRITSAGRRAFLVWLRGSATRVRDVRLEFLSRLYFIRRLGLEGLEEAVARQEEALASKVASLDRGIAEAAAVGDEYWRLVLEFRRSEALAIVGWLHACVKE